MKKRIMILLMDGFEEIEALAPVDILRRAGIDVQTASCSGELQLEGAHHLRVYADRLLTELDMEDFDGLLIPGGPAVMELRQNAAVIALAQKAAKLKKMIAAVCGGPLVLKDAGLLQGKHFTAHFSTFDELVNADEKNKVVQDGELITACGPGGTAQFSFTIVAHLLGDVAAKQVSKAMCY